MTLPTAKEISKTNDPCCVACKKSGAEEAFRAVAKELRRISEMNISPIEQWIEVRRLIRTLDGEKVKQ